MAEEQPKSAEVQDRGLFDFVGKKEEEKDCHEEVLVTGVEKIHIEEEQKVEEEKKESFLEKLHRSHSSSSSSSSDEEGGEGENKEKKKKKKGLKEKLKEKLGGEKEGEEVYVVEQEVVGVTGDGEDTAVLVEKVEESIMVEPEEEKKGFLEKIKEKLPGHKKPAEEAAPTAPAPAPPVACNAAAEGDGHEAKEKKGILGKLMEKIPGYHKAEEKEGEK